MSDSLVSIIMPAYNVEKYISESIESVINQTYQNWELIIVDDCSIDNTKDIIKSFEKQDKRIKVVFRKRNGGKPSITKNSAIKYIKGDYIAFLDSDDLWLPQKLEIQMGLLKDSDYKLCYSGGYLIDENENEIGNFLPKYKNGYIFKQMLFKYEINNQSVLIKRDVFRKFNEDITIGEDYNLFMEIVLNNKVCNIKKKLVKYRIHHNSLTKSKIKDLSEGTLYTLRELNEKYDILKNYFIGYVISWLNAMKFKLFY